MHSNNHGERDMSKFVKFTAVWGKLTPWQKLQIYAHVMIQYRIIGFVAVFGSALIAAVFAMLISENIYISLAIGGAAGVAIARY